MMTDLVDRSPILRSSRFPEIESAAAAPTSEDVAGFEAPTSEDVAGFEAPTSEDVAGFEAPTFEDVAAAAAHTSEDVEAAVAATFEDAAGSAASIRRSTEAAVVPIPLSRYGRPLGLKKDPAPPHSDVNPGAAGIGTGIGGSEGEGTGANEQGTQICGKRRRGRPKGSKNKPKAVGNVAVPSVAAGRRPGLPVRSKNRASRLGNIGHHDLQHDLVPEAGAGVGAEAEGGNGPRAESTTRAKKRQKRRRRNEEMDEGRAMHGQPSANGVDGSGNDDQGDACPMEHDGDVEGRNGATRRASACLDSELSRTRSHLEPVLEPDSLFPPVVVEPKRSSLCSTSARNNGDVIPGCLAASTGSEGGCGDLELFHRRKQAPVALTMPVMDAEATVPRSGDARGAASSMTAETAAAVTTPRRGRPKGSKNKPKGPGDGTRATPDVGITDLGLKSIHLSPTEFHLFEAWKLSLQGRGSRNTGSCSMPGADSQQPNPEDTYDVAGNEEIDPVKAVEDQDNTEGDRNRPTLCMGQVCPRQDDDSQNLLTTVYRLAGILPLPEREIVAPPPQWAVDVMLGASVESMMEELDGAARNDFTPTGQVKWIQPDSGHGART